MKNCTSLKQGIIGLLNYKRKYASEQELERVLADRINNHCFGAHMDCKSKIIKDGSGTYAYRLFIGSKSNSRLNDIHKAVEQMEKEERAGKITGGIAIYVTSKLDEWNNDVISIERSSVTGKYYTEQWGEEFDPKIRYAIFQTQGAENHL